jgi:serine/threonine protein kinase
MGGGGTARVYATPPGRKSRPRSRAALRASRLARDAAGLIASPPAVTGTGEHPLPDAAPSPPLAPGAVFAKRYKLVRRMSAGVMADLYEAEHVNTRRRVALKVLQPEVMAEPLAVERFRREATACANIDSEHIVEVIDSDVDPDSGRPFLVMEYLQGRDLAQHIAATWGAHAPIPTAQTLTLLRQVASALDKVHAAGIVHRDLKPANLFLVTPADGPPRVKIVDFGVAKLVRERSGSEGERIGTPLYMAPEQLTQGATVSPATDVWALALIAYELFVGAPYWEGNTAASLFERIPDRRQHPLPSTLAAARGVKLGPPFDRWLLRCIDPDPAQRPASAGTAIAELFRLLDPNATQPPTRRGEPVPAAIASDLEEAQRQGRAPREQYARTEPNIPAAIARNARPARPAARPGPSANGRAAAPRVPAALAAELEGASSDEAAKSDEAAERPTIPASRMHAQRPRPAGAPASRARSRDADEARTIKMPTVPAMLEGRQTMEALPLVRRGGSGEDPLAGRQTMEALPLVTEAAHPRPTMDALPLVQQAPAPAARSATPAAAPAAPGPTSPPTRGDLLSRRISQAAEESEAAADLVANPARRAAVAGAVTTLLPVVARPARSPRIVPLVAVGVLALGLVGAAAIALLQGREAHPEGPPPTAALAPPDRDALRACVARWADALLARPAASGEEAAEQFASLLRGHTAGRTIAPDQQLRLLGALDRARGPQGWGGAAGAATGDATAWALVAYAQMAQANRAATALDRVRLAAGALAALRRPDGAFADAAGRPSDEATALAVWGLVEARRAGLTGEPTDGALTRAAALSAARITAGAVAPGVDAMTFWALWQGRALGTVASADAPPLARAFAQTLLARCPPTRGCAAAPSWEPWTALALTELLRDPPASLDLATRGSLTALRALAIGRVGGSAERIANVPTGALAPWLFAAAELQR